MRRRRRLRWLSSALGALAAVGLLEARAPQQQVPPPTPEPPGAVQGKPPGPVQTIAGMRGLDVRTRVRFHDPEVPEHRRSISLRFPDCGRWQLERVSDEPEPSVIAYRYGEQAFHRLPGAPESLALVDHERERTRLHFEMLRATLLWPDGFEWLEGPDGSRHVALEGGGHLVAQLGPDGRPEAMRAFDACEVALESLQGIQWKPGVCDRTWPMRWELHADGEPVWEEEVQGLSPGKQFGLSFFLPADRRAGAARVRVPETGVRRTLIPATRVVRLALEGQPSVAAAQERAAQFARALEARGVALLPAVGFPLSSQGAPTEAWIPLAEGSDPEGLRVESHPPSVAFRIELGRGAFDATALAQLEAAAREAGLQPGTPYLSRIETQPSPVWRMVLPVREPD